jgi:pimeloyl-ACP methyl ester carboxylesterase
VLASLLGSHDGTKALLYQSSPQRSKESRNVLDQPVYEPPPECFLHRRRAATARLTPDQVLDRLRPGDTLVVQTPETLRHFQETVAPGVALADQVALERMSARWRLSAAPDQGPAYANPTLILAGRQDATVGYAAAWRLLEHYPRASFALLDRAGHGFPHEQAGLLGALLAEWLDRVG